MHSSYCTFLNNIKYYFIFLYYKILQWIFYVIHKFNNKSAEWLKNITPFRIVVKTELKYKFKCLIYYLRLKCLFTSYTYDNNLIF